MGYYIFLCDPNSVFYTDDILEHHGIKGQKWGITRSDEQLGHRPSAKPGDVVLKRGTKFQRITTASNTGYTTGVYTSYKISDKDLYKGVLGRMRVTEILKENGDVKLNEMTMTARKDIRLPSKQTRIDEFKKLYEKDPQGVMNLINDHEISRYNRKASNEFDSSNDHKAKSMYEKFNDSLALGTNSKYGNVIQKYYDNLSKKGYDAIPDENDIRLSTFKAQAPIIMFDTKKSIGSTKVRELNASEVYSAYVRAMPKKTLRDVAYIGNIGIERLPANVPAKAKSYAKQLEKDKYALNKNYSMKDLAEDWQNNRLTAYQIQKVSSKMDSGKTHEQSVQEVITVGNTAVDIVLGKFGL